MPKNEFQTRKDIKRKQCFLDHLAETSNVAASARHALIAQSTLYLWRKTDRQFRQDWMDALAAGYALLEAELLRRAREGVEKQIFHHGKLVATFQEYDNGMALRLLALHRDMVAKIRAAQLTDGDNGSALRQQLDRKIGDMRRRMIRRGAFDGGHVRHDYGAAGRNRPNA